MEYGICQLSVVPIRAEPSDKSEIVTQLLFGETLELILKEGNWHKIRCSWDGYEGWMDAKQYTKISVDYFQQLLAEPGSVAGDLVQSATNHIGHVPVVIGSSLPGYDGMNFKIGKQKFVYNGRAFAPEQQRQVAEQYISRCAKMYLNAPYLWGGRSPFGIDCSGFTQVVYKLMGHKLPRDAYQQAEIGQVVDFINQAKEGDLAYFHNEEDRITHVGIILEAGKIIHAHGQVRIDLIDHFGIYNQDQKKYTHQLKVIKRIL